jgi:hypothetical protein
MIAKKPLMKSEVTTHLMHIVEGKIACTGMCDVGIIEDAF